MKWYRLLLPATICQKKKQSVCTPTLWVRFGATFHCAVIINGYLLERRAIFVGGTSHSLLHLPPKFSVTFTFSITGTEFEIQWQMSNFENWVVPSSDEFCCLKMPLPARAPNAVLRFQYFNFYVIKYERSSIPEWYFGI